MSGIRMWHAACSCDRVDLFDSAAPRKYLALSEAYALHGGESPRDHEICLTAVDAFVARRIRAEQRRRLETSGVSMPSRAAS